MAFQMPMIEKSIIRGCFYVGGNLVRWMSKKENPILLSTAESEYIAESYTQLLWMKKMLKDYDFSQNIWLFIMIIPVHFVSSKNIYNIHELSI